MRSVMMLMVVAAMFAGCMHYPRYRQARRTGPERAVAPDSQLPPGKILVQDMRTGNLILIDDPNQDSLRQPEPEPEPQPRVPARIAVPVPRLPSPRALPRPRILLPQGPELPPVFEPASDKARAKFKISLEAFAFDVKGAVTGHSDFPYESADFTNDLGLEDGAGVTLNLGLVLPKGAEFRVSLSFLSAEGREIEPIIYGDPYFMASVDLTIIDLAFTPMAYFGNWGSLSMETGLRYAQSRVTIVESDRHAEGVMIMAGGELGLNLHRDVLSATAAGAIGLGTDSFSIEFEAGLKLKASPNFHLALVYRLMAISVTDSSGEVDERSLGFGAAGPALELGLSF